MTVARSSFALILIVLLSHPALGRGLATDDQIAHERTLMAVLSRPEMRAATRRVEAAYRADAQALTPAGRARLRRAASSIATAAANYAVAEHPGPPRVVWWVNAPHRWHGMSVPGSGYGIDNPDNVYQGMAVEGGGRYVLHGRLRSPGPVQLHLEVRDSIPGMGEMLAEGGQLLATIQTEDITVAADGSFTITIDSQPVAERTNHLTVPASGNFLVNVRQLFTDWGNQRPVYLRLERIDPAPHVPPADIPTLARRSAAILDRIARYWLDYDNRFIFSRPANQFGPPRIRPGGRGIVSSAHYALASDEALVITLDPLSAVSLGVQITDPWGVAYDYDRRVSSLNQVQAEPDSDGCFTFVVSARDPGLANWLDSGGAKSGMVIARWQGLPAGADASFAFRKVSIVKLADLPRLAPAGQSSVNPARRAAQRQLRARDYARRLTD